MEYVNEEDLKNELVTIQKSKRLNELSQLEMLSEEEYQEKLTLIAEGIIPKYSKEKFGNMVLQIVTKLATRGNFAGYTWKDEFYSNAIEKILSYAVNNFDANMISTRSGKGVKAFAYITQIAMNAFIAVINERREETQFMMTHLAPLDDLYSEVKKNYAPIYDRLEEEKEQPDIILNYTSEEEATTAIITNNIDISTAIFDGSPDSVYNILQGYRNTYSKIAFIYPPFYTISLSEAEKIKELKFDYLSVRQYSKERYKPSFPKRQKKEIIDMFEDWKALDE